MASIHSSQSDCICSAGKARRIPARISTRDRSPARRTRRTRTEAHPALANVYTWASSPLSGPKEFSRGINPQKTIRPASHGRFRTQPEASHLPPARRLFLGARKDHRHEDVLRVLRSALWACRAQLLGSSSRSPQRASCSRQIPNCTIRRSP